jgi:hypothetical protein
MEAKIYGRSRPSWRRQTEPNTDRDAAMTIAKHLTILLAVPLVGLLGLGIFTRLRFSDSETKSRFMAETQVGSLAALGNIPRSFAKLRVNARSYLLVPDPEVQLSISAALVNNEREVNRVSQWICI